MMNYNGTIWGHNSPAMFSNVFHENCEVPTSKIVEPQKCPSLDLTIFPVKKAYAIHFSIAEILFLPEKSEKVLKMVEDSFFVHINNSLVKEKKLPRNSTAAYMKLAEKFCPRVLKTLHEKLF